MYRRIGCIWKNNEGGGSKLNSLSSFIGHTHKHSTFCNLSLFSFLQLADYMSADVLIAALEVLSETPAKGGACSKTSLSPFSVFSGLFF